MTVDVREVFSKNLRELCDERPSVSAVCRDLSINRQQFARYLSGGALPSKDNLARICEYFGIVEGVLFDLNGLVDRPNSGDAVEGIGARVLDVLTDQSQARMPEGAYWCDYASSLFPKEIVRAVVLVRHEEKCTTFRRLTGHGEKRGTWWSAFRGDHEGIVVERRGTYFFTAINTTGLEEPSMLVMRPAPCDAFMLSGTATIMAIDGPAIIAVAMSKVPKSVPLLKVVRQARSYNIDDPHIPMQVIDLLQMEADRLAQMPKLLGGVPIPAE